MRYRKKPVVIDAIQWTYDNRAEIKGFMDGARYEILDDRPRPALAIWSQHGRMIAALDDYIIRGVAGEFYPCKPDIFAETYELCGDEE